MIVQIVSCFWLQRYNVVYIVYQFCIMLVIDSTNKGLWLCNLELEIMCLINGDS